MSRQLSFFCKCGEHNLGFCSHFTAVFWDDITRVFENLRISNPYKSVENSVEVDVKVFTTWFNQVMSILKSNKRKLPTLYRIWATVKEADDEYMCSAAAYFIYQKQMYMVDTAYDELLTYRLPDAIALERLSQISYQPPVVEKVLPKLKLTPKQLFTDDLNNEYFISPQDFEKLFSATPLHLEWGNYLDFFSCEFDDITQLIKHNVATNERVTIFTL